MLLNKLVSQLFNAVKMVEDLDTALASIVPVQTHILNPL